MPHSEPPADLLFSDPNREPTRAVDQITFHRSDITHLDVTYCAQVPVARSATEWGVESVVTARLRMDLAMAKTLAEGLAAQLAMYEAAASTRN